MLKVVKWKMVVMFMTVLRLMLLFLICGLVQVRHLRLMTSAKLKAKQTLKMQAQMIEKLTENSQVLNDMSNYFIEY